MGLLGAEYWLGLAGGVAGNGGSWGNLKVLKPAED